MVRKDFVEKQLEQLGLVIAKLIGDFLERKNDVSFELATSKVDEALHTEFELDLNELIAIDKKELIIYLTKNKQLKTGKLSLLADLLFATATFIENSGIQSTAEDLYLKTLILYEYINEQEKTFSETRQQKIAILKSKI